MTADREHGREVDARVLGIGCALHAVDLTSIRHEGQGER